MQPLDIAEALLQPCLQLVCIVKEVIIPHDPVIDDADPGHGGDDFTVGSLLVGQRAREQHRTGDRVSAQRQLREAEVSVGLGGEDRIVVLDELRDEGLPPAAGDDLEAHLPDRRDGVEADAHIQHCRPRLALGPAEEFDRVVGQHVVALLVEGDDPVGVAIEGDADIRALLDDRALQFLEMLLTRLRGPRGEVPVGLAVDRVHLHPEPLKRDLRGGNGGAAARIEDDLERPRRVRHLDQPVEVCGQDAVEGLDDTALVPCGPLEGLVQRRLGGILKLRPPYMGIGLHELDAVPLGGIVRRGDHAAGHAGMLRPGGDRSGGEDATVMDGHSAGREAAHESGAQSGCGDAVIAGDADLGVALIYEMASRDTAELRHHLGCQVLPDDPPEAVQQHGQQPLVCTKIINRRVERIGEVGALTSPESLCYPPPERSRGTRGGNGK